MPRGRKGAALIYARTVRTLVGTPFLLRTLARHRADRFRSRSSLIRGLTVVFVPEAVGLALIYARIRLKFAHLSSLSLYRWPFRVCGWSLGPLGYLLSGLAHGKSDRSLGLLTICLRQMDFSQPRSGPTPGDSFPLLDCRVSYRSDCVDRGLGQARVVR